MKKKILSIFTFLLFFLFSEKVIANEIKNIDMDIYVDKNGDAHITETWIATLNQGTEGYKPYYNLGKSTITDYSVTIDGTNYETLNGWDVSASFDEKAYKAGINNISNGVELCFGISSYGTHSYVMKYTITDFVAEVSDAQMIYWTLIPYELSSKPQNINIRIYSDEKYLDTLDVWGYGNYGGTAYVYDGQIEMNSDGELDSNEYMTILVKFDKGTFNTDNILDNDFNYYYEMAEDGATHYQEENKSVVGILTSVLTFIVTFGMWIFIVLAILLSSIHSSKTGKAILGSKKLLFGKTGNKVPNDVGFYRDIPCNKDLYFAYWVAVNYKLVKKQTDFLGAILLRWLNMGIIKIKSEEKEGISKRVRTSIIFVPEKKNLLTLKFEQELFDYMVEASKDGILEKKEFGDWCYKHYNKILNWFGDIIDYVNDALIANGKIKEGNVTTLKIFKSKVYEVDPSMMEYAKQMKGLKNFLVEFSNIKERQAIEVSLWKEYLMYAQIFGIADKVAKQFKELYPDVIIDANYDIEDIVFINTISYDGMANAGSAKSEAEARARSYSSGGGGFSSGGGGGGSFGGGGGGGGFR